MDELARPQPASPASWFSRFLGRRVSGQTGANLTTAINEAEIQLIRYLFWSANILNICTCWYRQMNIV
jgi:hypothetical protein